MRAPATRETFCYEAFGLGIRSELRLPELRRSTGKPDIDIRLTQLGFDAPAGDEWSSVCQDGTFVGWEGVGTFRVSGGCEIAVDSDPAVTPDRLRLFLLGAAIGVLLHQRGRLVLHASAMEVDGGAVAFLGPKWWGKSTMAAILHARGYKLITDDVLAVDLAAPTPLVLPGVPQMKLWPDTLELVGKGRSNLPRLHADLEKRDYRIAARFTREATPLRAVYVLGPAEAPSVEAMDSRAALSELIGHWYCARFSYETLKSLGIESHFLGSADLVSRVPFYHLGRPRKLTAMPQVATAVERSLGIERATTHRTDTTSEEQPKSQAVRAS